MGLRRFGNARHPSVPPPNPTSRHGRTVPGNARITTAVVHVPDAWSIQTAGSLGLAVNTFSPMARGSRNWRGDPGYGVNGNRWAGRTTSPQAYVGAAVYPVGRPPTARVGSGYGASDGGSYPNTLADRAGLQALAQLNPTQLTRHGMG